MVTGAEAQTITAMPAAAALVACTLAIVPNPPHLESDFSTALGLAGLTPATAVFDPGLGAFYRQSSAPAALFEPCYDKPFRMPFVMDMTRRQLALAPARPGSMFEVGSRLVGHSSRRSLISDPGAAYLERAKPKDGLSGILAAMRAEGLIKGAVPPLTSVPPDVQTAAGCVLAAALDLVSYRRAAFADLGDLGTAFDFVRSHPGEPENATVEARSQSVQARADMAYLYAAAQDIGAAVSLASASARLAPADKAFDWKLETSWGLIQLSGTGNTVHDGTATLLVIDLGGDDTYINCPCTTTAANWLSVVIDTQGNDAYLSDPALAKTSVADWPGRQKSRDGLGPGAALFGLTFLVDSQGDDVCRSARRGIGSAVFGASYWGDSIGNDTYDCYEKSEGFGHYGIGVLDDQKGADRYDCFTESQGVGLPQGVGLLSDQAGDDSYNANDKVLDFPSAQSADHNNSMSQGAGYGFRGDYLTGHSQSGGVGVLFDMAGKDTYSCGVFGQGVGYWEGVGALWDDSGDDTYAGQWYVQGASAHFGIGYLEDKEGTDQYRAPMNMAQGAGHDFGIGMLIDWAGNDLHEAPGLSLGAGNANGIGVFVDVGGDDSYRSSGISLGQAADGQKASLRERALCLGVFMDLGGNDSYPDFATWAQNGSRSANWTTKNDLPAESQVGVFLDR